MKINLFRRLSVGSVTALILINSCAPSGGPGPFDSAPAAQTPVFDQLTPDDPVGDPKPAGAPFFINQILKFHVPTLTLIDVAVDGYILREWQEGDPPQKCGDIGCYIVLSHKENPSGQDNYLIKAIPPAYKRFAAKLEFEIIDSSINPTLTGEAKVSPPLRLIMLEAADINGTPSPASIPGTPEWAAFNDAGFLNFPIGLSDQQENDRYSQAVDPTGSKKTFRDWKIANGFNPDNDSADDAHAVFYNAGDLGLGRSMHMKKQNGNIAYYVSNYPTVEDARRGSNLIATVAMDDSPLTPGGPKVTKFYAYKADGTSLPNPDLDGERNADNSLGKYIPRLCIICHGGSVSNLNPSNFSPDLGARFIPFDLSSYQYSSVGGFGRSEQEWQFKQFNLGILDTNKSSSMESLIQAWYGGALFPRDTQDSDAVPPDWTGHEALYLMVVKTSCRSCHITRDSPKDFGSFASFDSKSPLIQSYVCSLRKMPQAKVTYQIFWLQHLRLPNSTSPTNQVGVLNQAGLSGWNSTAPCP